MNRIYQKKNDDFEFQLEMENKHLAVYPHMHYHIELAYMVEGQSNIVVDKKDCKITSDSISVTFPNQIHSYYGNDYERYNLFIFSPSMVPELQNYFTNFVPECPICYNVSQDAILSTALNVLKTECEKNGDKCRKNVVKGCVLIIMTQLLSKLPLRHRKGNENGERINEIVDYCLENFNNDISLEILSHDLHLSKYYISHIFSDKFDMCFSDYISQLRVSEGTYLLTHTDMSITEISEKVGFGTTRSFNRAFLKFIGVSPLSYRKGECDINSQFATRKM